MYRTPTVPVVQGVGPDGDPAKRGGDGGVVGEELVGHHAELLVAAHAQVGRTHTNHRTVGDVRKPLDDQPAREKIQIAT